MAVGGPILKYIEKTTWHRFILTLKWVGFPKTAFFYQ